MRPFQVIRIAPACLALSMLLASAAHGQPEDRPAATGPDQPSANEPGADEPIVVPRGSDHDPDHPADPYAAGEPGPGGAAGDVQPAVPDPAVKPADPGRAPATAPLAEDEPLEMPILFNAPSGHLLPAGIILSEIGVDTGGGFTSDIRVGLGDVAEFGVGTNALINVRRGRDGEPEAIDAYPTALFKMGISENLLFPLQPALAVGFRKSFEVDHDGRSTRLAQLYLVASKNLCSRFRLHGGGVFWDASIERGDGAEVRLHDSGVRRQLRAFGGIEIEPLPRSQILLELHWVPEFVLGDDTTADRISLTPTLSWGVRYQLADWMMFESGVRVPNIKDVNLIDAQIFGQVRFVTHRFRRFLKGLN